MLGYKTSPLCEKKTMLHWQYVSSPHKIDVMQHFTCMFEIIVKLPMINATYNALNGTPGYQINIPHLTTWWIIIWYPRVPFNASYMA
jgi:hypothetical protein